MTTISKALLSAILLTGMVGSGVMTIASANASDRIEQQIYQSRDFGRLAKHIRMDLQRQGYHVMNVKADDHHDKPAIKVYAKKGNQAYEMKYSYPDLKLIESKQKAWSQLWENDYQQDHEDKIKKSIYSDSNFESIKSKAKSKLEAMGYKIDEIKADDYKKQAVLEVDADRGGKEYEIRLSYPDLQILTIEED